MSEATLNPRDELFFAKRANIFFETYLLKKARVFPRRLVQDRISLTPTAKLI